MRDIDRPDAPHPAPHRMHEFRHLYEVSAGFDPGQTRVRDQFIFLTCCEHPASHPIHLNRWKNS